MATLPVMTVHEERTNEWYAQRFGQWVTARILKRIELKVAEDPTYRVPEYVQSFLDGVFNPKVPGETEAGPSETGWLIKSIEDPSWPRH